MAVIFIIAMLTMLITGSAEATRKNNDATYICKGMKWF